MRRKNLPLNALRAFEAAARLGRLTVIDGEEVLRARDALLFQEQIGLVLVPALMPSAKQLRTSGLSSIPRLATRTRPNAWPTWDALVGASAVETKIKPAAQFEHYYF